MKRHRIITYAIALLAIAIAFPAGAGATVTNALFTFEPPVYSQDVLQGQGAAGETWKWTANSVIFNVITNNIGWTVAETQTLEMKGAGPGYVPPGGWATKYLNVESRLTGGVEYLDFYLLPMNSSQRTSIYLDTPANNHGTGIMFGEDGHIKYYDGSTSFADSGVVYSNGQYRLTEKLDLDAGTYNIYLNSDPTPWRSGLGIYGGAVTPDNQLAAIEIYSGQGYSTDRSYLDNFVVTDVAPAFLIPEPASIVLLGLGVLALLRRKLS